MTLTNPFELPEHGKLWSSFIFQRCQRFTMRGSNYFVAFGLLTIISTSVLAQENRQEDIEPRQIAQSKPVVAKNAKFVLAAQTDWKRAKPNDAFTAVAPIEIQLQITNLDKSEVLLPTKKALAIRLFDERGKEVKARVEGQDTIETRPLLLPAGASYTICRVAELWWDEKTRAANLIFADGTGKRSIHGPLELGRYKLVFSYSTTANKKPIKNAFAGRCGSAKLLLMKCSFKCSMVQREDSLHALTKLPET